MLFLETRRTFLKTSFLGTAVLVMSGCDIFGAVSPRETLDMVQSDLFPFTTELNVNVFTYLSLVLNHSRVTDEDKQFLRNGIQWLNEEAILKYDTLYTKLSLNKRQEILQIISKKNWGESWIETILTYTMEAMFSDKLYGVNLQENAHKWLSFEMGLPRPKEALL